MFFNSIEEIQKYVDVNISFKFPLIEPKLKTIDRDVLKLHFGFDFIEEIQAEYDSLNNAPITNLPLASQKLIEKLRYITAPLAYALYVTPGQLQIDSSGIFVAKSENRGIAWEWQIKDLIKSFLKPGYQAIEDCILFLQKNIVDYSTYEDSEEFEYSKLCFVPTAKEFTKYYSPLKNSYISFCMMRSCMDKIDEQEIANVLLPDYYALLKTRLRTDTLTIADKAIVPYIKKAIVNLTVYKAMNELNMTFDENGFLVYDNTSGVKSGASKKTGEQANLIPAKESLLNSGMTYITTLKKFLEDNITSYTVYASDPKYVANQSSSVENSTDQHFFNAL